LVSEGRLIPQDGTTPTSFNRDPKSTKGRRSKMLAIRSSVLAKKSARRITAVQRKPCDAVT